MGKKIRGKNIQDSDILTSEETDEPEIGRRMGARE